jgi:hypothetical protein
MSEVLAIPQAIQTLGLIAPAIACCFVKLKREGAIRYFQSDIGKNYFKITNKNVPALTEETLIAHDHEVGGAQFEKKKKGQLVVEIPKDGKNDLFVVNPNEIEITDNLTEGETSFVKEGDPIPGMDLIHNHNGSQSIGPWEY